MAACWCPGTGYTGEDGFEIVGSDKAIQQVWDKILAVGRSVRHQALRSRRARHVAHGGLLSALRPRTGRKHDADGSRAGIFCFARQGRFHRARDSGGTKSQRHREKIGCLQNDRKIRATAAALSDLGERCAEVGDVTSGTQSPSLGIGIGMGYVPPELAKPGTEIEIEIRGKRSPALVVARPIYRRS